MEQTLTLAPTADPKTFKAPDGSLHTVPAGWALLPPGDAGLTRRVKAAGPSWTVVEKKGRKLFSRGVWAPAANVAAAREELSAERASPSYAKKLEAGRRRREAEQAEYVEDFCGAVLSFLRFSSRHEPLARAMAAAVTEHATPVGSGTVARTERIPIEERAEAAVIAWMRHQTTAYDDMQIARIKGERRRVRAMLAERSRKVLGAHREGGLHPEAGCPLCKALARATPAAPTAAPAEACAQP